MRNSLEWCLKWFPPRFGTFIRWGFGLRSVESFNPAPPGRITVIIPAHNEALDIARTLESIKKQSLPTQECIVMDDASDDATGDISRNMGVRVVRLERGPDGKTQGKAANQKFGVSLVQTEYVGFIDADTELYPDALDMAMLYFNEPNTKAVGGFVLPKYLRNVWELGRQCQYLYGFGTAKAAQNNCKAIFVSSGCHSIFDVKTVTELGIDIDTIAEDLDLTWKLLEAGHDVRFAPDSLCFVVDPSNFVQYVNQGYRWQFGFFQNFRKRAGRVLKMGGWFAFNTYFGLTMSLAGPVFEVVGLLGMYQSVSHNIFSSGKLAATPLGIIGQITPTLGTVGTTLLLSFVWIFIFSWLPVIATAFSLWRKGRINKSRFLLTFVGLPCFLFLHYIDVPLYYKAFFDVMILNRKKPKKGWGKGHAEAPIPLEAPEALAARLLAHAGRELPSSTAGSQSDEEWRPRFS